MAKKRKNQTREKVEWWRLLLCIIFPPLAVIDKGLSEVLIVVLLTLLGYLPGVVAAVLIIYKK